MSDEPELAATPCPHPEWEVFEASLGASGGTAWARCVLCQAVAPDVPDG